MAAAERSVQVRFASNLSEQVRVPRFSRKTCENDVGNFISCFFL
jgi:hypothetical protein